MVSYRLTAVALDALCLSAQRQEGGNITHSLDYLPGATVRGAFAATAAGVLLRSHDYNTFLDLFERGKAVFEPLRPAFGDMEGFPVPCSARACKTEGGFTRAHGLQDYLLARDGISAQCGQDECRSPLVRAPGWYGVDAAQASFPISVVRPTGLHNEIEDETGVTREGILFALQEIEAGTQFIGYVRLFDGAETLFEPFTNGTEVVLRVGRDRGRVRITQAIPLTEDHEPYQRKGTFDQRWAAQAGDGMTGEFTLTLLSDALLRDEYGGFYRSLTEEAINTELHRYGFEGTVEVAQTSEGLPRSYCGYRAVSGWRGSQGIFTPQAFAVVQGSAARFTYQGDETELKAALRELEQRGIGDQCAQGFGRVLIKDPWHTLALTSQHAAAPAFPLSDEALTDSDLQAFIQHNIKRLIPDDLCSEVPEALMSLGAASQLHALRNLVLRESNPQAWRSFLAHEAEKSNSRWNRVGRRTKLTPEKAVKKLFESLSAAELAMRLSEQLQAVGGWLEPGTPQVTVTEGLSRDACRAAIEYVTRQAHARMRSQAQGGNEDGGH